MWLLTVVSVTVSRSDDLRRGSALGETAGGFDAVAAGHAQVHQYDVGLFEVLRQLCEPVGPGRSSSPSAAIARLASSRPARAEVVGSVERGC
jgi:hypothetical protein